MCELIFFKKEIILNCSILKIIANKNQPNNQECYTFKSGKNYTNFLWNLKEITKHLF